MLPIAERLVQREPLDERALRTLMRGYQTLGRRGAALAAYERCVALLLDEIGVEPEPATRALAQAIRALPGALSGRLQPDQDCPPDGEQSHGDGYPPDGDKGPAELLREARAALARGDASSVKDFLAVLCSRPDSDRDEVRLLAIDLALFYEDFARADALLRGADLCAATMDRRLREAQLALGRYDAAAARALAAEALAMAREAGTHGPDGQGVEIEVEALLILARAQQQLGKGGHAARSIERALVLARSGGFHHWMAQALLLDGQRRIDQGRYGGAHACLREAYAIALEHGLRRETAAALRGLRIVLSHTNALAEALAAAQQELSLWRDLGLPRQEAAALEGLALVENHLGRSADSLATMQRAIEISRGLGEPVRLGISLYNLAASRIYHDDALAGDALESGREALDIFRAHEQAHWAAAAQTILGYISWVDGRYSDAVTHLQEAHMARDRLGELGYLPELLAYQGLAHLGLDRADEALRLTRLAMSSLDQGEVSDEVVPDILYAHAMALAAKGREGEAQRYFEQAYSLLVGGAAAFVDDAARQAYFHRNPTTRRLMHHLRKCGIAPPSGAGVQTVRLRGERGGGELSVAWTVDAGPTDVALKRAGGGVALRRARLARLLTESRAQGGVPTVADLASALDVSPRTIQRDLAVLRG